MIKGDLRMEFYTEDQIKDMLQLGTKQCHALMKTEGFPSIQIGRLYRVPVEAFKKWVGQTKSISLDYSGI